MQEDKHLSDQELVHKVQSGDFEAFRQIVLRYSNALLSVAYGVLEDFHEAQDVTQEVFVKCFNHFHTLKDPNRLGSWLYAITHRTSLDFLKKKKPTLLANETLESKSEHIHTWLDQHILQETLTNALQTLEEKSKTAVVLYYLSDWSMKEIGQFLNLSVTAVESRIRRARETLKRTLSDDFAPYFTPYRLGTDFEQSVCEHILKRMGHFYIPVSNRRKSTEWFVLHFHLGISNHGNLLLESGHELYLLECTEHVPTQMPVLTFSVSDIDQLWLHLTNNAVTTEVIEHNEWFGKHFIFYDLDGNKFIAIENF